jgi:hypothetical protein
VRASRTNRNGFAPVVGDTFNLEVRSGDGWLLPSVGNVALTRLGLKAGGGGPHQSKTMMFADLASLLASGRTDDLEGAVVRENLLGKPSIRAREAAFYRLQQLYGVAGNDPIWRTLQGLWNLEIGGRPLLALRPCWTPHPVSESVGQLSRRHSRLPTPGVSARRWQNRSPRMPRRRGHKRGS